MPIRTRRCEDCGTDYEILVSTRFGREECSSLQNLDMDDLSCPTCHSTRYLRIIGSAHGIDLGGEAGVGKHYPYFDQGLGCEVRDAAHRRWLLRHHPDGTVRDAPLIPVEGDWNAVTDAAETIMHRRQDFDEAYAREQEFIHSDPEVRKAKDVLARMAKDKTLHELFRGPRQERIDHRVKSSY